MGGSLSVRDRIVDANGVRITTLTCSAGFVEAKSTERAGMSERLCARQFHVSWLLPAA